MTDWLVGWCGTGSAWRVNSVGTTIIISYPLGGGSPYLYMAHPLLMKRTLNRMAAKAH